MLWFSNFQTDWKIKINVTLMIISLRPNKFWCLDYKRSVYISLLVIIQSFPILSRSFVTLFFVHTHTQTGITAWAIDTRRVLTSRLNANIILTKKGPFSCVVCFVSDRGRFLTIVQINHHTATLFGLGKVLFDEFHWNSTMWSGERDTSSYKCHHPAVQHTYELPGFGVLMQ